MTLQKAAAKISRSRPCRHKHLSGRRCAQRLRKPYLVNGQTGEVAWICVLHRNGECDECDAMLRAFPLRKDVTIGSSNQ